MPRTQPHAPRLALLGVIGSGLALLTFAAIGIWRSLQASRDQLALLAAQECRRVAQAMQQSLLSDVDPPGVRFTVRDGELVVPEDVGWLTAPAPASVWQRAADDEVRRLDMLASEATADALATTLAKERATLEANDATLLTTSPKLMAAAFFAHRRSDGAWRDAALARLAALGEGEQLPTELADTLAISAALLRASAGRSDTADWLVAALPGALGRLPEADAEAVLTRLTELGSRADHAALRNQVAAVAAHRRALQVVARQVAPLTRTSSAWLAVLDREVDTNTAAPLLRYWPTAPGQGHGALTPAADTLRAAFSAARPGSVRLVFPPTTDDVDSGAPVCDGAARVVPALADTGDTPWLLALLLAAIAVLFSGALWSTLRGLRRAALAQQARSEFLTSVTHELKTPLASLRLLSELLASGRVHDRAEQQEYHDLLASETTRLTALVENVLDLGRTERGERALERARVPLDELLAEAIAVLQPVCSRDGVPLSLAPVAPELCVLGDRGALTQALLNVLDNARKYGRSTLGVEVTAGRDGERVTIHVRDFGPGVPSGERDAVFDKFVRGRAQADGSVPGLGLGLYLARALVRAQAGELALVPSEVGALFVFTLPPA